MNTWPTVVHLLTCAHCWISISVLRWVTDTGNVSSRKLRDAISTLWLKHLQGNSFVCKVSAHVCVGMCECGYYQCAWMHAWASICMYIYLPTEDCFCRYEFLFMNVLCCKLIVRFLARTCKYMSFWTCYWISKCFVTFVSTCKNINENVNECLFVYVCLDAYGCANTVRVLFADDWLWVYIAGHLQEHAHIYIPYFYGLYTSIES